MSAANTLGSTSPEKILLWHHRRECASFLRTYRLKNDRPRPAVLITPGGGYQMVCEPSEGGPVAKKFNALGFHAFVLNYRVAPLPSFPAPQQDAMRAMKIIRAHAEAWGVDPARLGVCGFSAGGHLAASLGTTIVNGIDASDDDECDGFSARPDFIIAGQGSLSFREPRVTSDNLLGPDRSDGERQRFSVELRVDEHTPPCFLWHTFADHVSGCEGSIRVALALKELHVPCELHIFADGDHGILLGMDTPDVSQWPQLAKTFIETHTGAVRTPRENYTHLHQCEAMHTHPGPWHEGEEPL